MLDILASFGEMVLALVDFVINAITSLFTFVANIPVYFNFITVLIASLPPWLLPYTVAGISLTVVAMLIQRKII